MSTTTWDAVYLHHTENGVKVDIDGTVCWLPRSQVEMPDPYELGEGEVFEIEVPDWLATENGFA